MAHHIDPPAGPGDGSSLAFKLVGLTGGIASGKSTVTEALASYGLVIIDADCAAREVVAPGTPGLAAVRDAFGDGILHPDGALDRAALGAHIFANPEARKQLGRLLHPLIGMRTAQLTTQVREAGHPLAIYDAPLIVENNLHAEMHLLVVVSTSPDIQRARLMARDGLSADEAEQRIQAQLPLQDKVAVADVVIDNDGTREQTRAQVHQLVERLPSLLWPIAAHTTAPDAVEAPDNAKADTHASAWIQTRLRIAQAQPHDPIKL